MAAARPRRMQKRRLHARGRGRWGAALELFDEALAIGGAPDPWVLHELRAQALLGLTGVLRRRGPRN